VATVPIKLFSLIRTRGVLLLIISVISALAFAKGGIAPLGFWDGPS
jgi:hypothetical protein